MDIRDALARKQTLSFEIFPPKGDLSVEQADTIAHALAQSDPDWISVTFSAGGSGNAQSSRAIAALVERECAPTQALAHLTCMGLAAADADASVDALLAEGVHNVLALRGDRVPGCGTRDFPHASDLVAHIKHRTPEVCVGGACYPEGHVECESLDADIEALKAQFEADVAESDEELRRVIAARRALADRLPHSLLEEYEDARRRNGALAVIEVRDGYGIGVAADLSPMELERIRLTPADELYLTEDTAQIVVRTAANTPR